MGDLRERVSTPIAADRIEPHGIFLLAEVGGQEVDLLPALREASASGGLASVLDVVYELALRRGMRE